MDGPQSESNEKKAQGDEQTWNRTRVSRLKPSYLVQTVRTDLPGSNGSNRVTRFKPSYPVQPNALPNKPPFFSTVFYKLLTSLSVPDQL